MSTKKLLLKSLRNSELPGLENPTADFAFMMSDAQVYGKVLKELLKLIEKEEFDYVAGLEATGLPMAGALASAKKAGMVMVRKSGKLPGKILATESILLPYKKENIKLETQADLDLKGRKILLFDEGVDSGATLRQAVNLLSRMEPRKIVVLTILNLPGLREIEKAEVRSLVFGELVH